MPGSDFASYRWGNTVDPITPGLTDRPYVARELIPYGTPETNDLLNALDGRIQEGLIDPDAIAPIARLMSAGDILLRSDLQVDRYNLVRPKQMELLLNPPPQGIGAPTGYGTSLGPPLDYPLLDEKALALPAGTRDPAPVEVFPVDGAPSIVRAQPVADPLVVAGGGDGTGRHRRPRHARREQPRPVLGVVRGPPGRAPQAGRHRRRRPRRDRLEPAPRPPLEHGSGERGLHGTAGREAVGARPVRRPTRRLSRRGRRLVHRDRATRREGAGVGLRQQHLVHARGPSGARDGRRSPHGVEGGRLRRRRGRAHPRHARPSRDDRSHRSRAAALRRPQPLDHRGDAAPRRRARDHDESRRRIAHGRRPDRHVPAPHGEVVRHHRRRHQPREAAELQRCERRRVRRDAHSRRRSRRAGRARRGGHAHACRPDARRRPRLARAPPRLLDESLAHDPRAAPVLRGRAEPDAGIRRAGRARVRPRGERRGSRPPRPTSSSTSSSASPAPTPVGSRPARPPASRAISRPGHRRPSTAILRPRGPRRSPRPPDSGWRSMRDNRSRSTTSTSRSWRTAVTPCRPACASTPTDRPVRSTSPRSATSPRRTRRRRRRCRSIPSRRGTCA